jgi:hypothetical protein
LLQGGFSRLKQRSARLFRRAFGLGPGGHASHPPLHHHHHHHHHHPEHSVFPPYGLSPSSTGKRYGTARRRAQRDGDGGEDRGGVVYGSEDELYGHAIHFGDERVGPGWVEHEAE